ncbi:MAG: hypothetical protein NTZ30_06020 [Planctomycetota bacterium]|nr:hypothetical protein [Planctomycetota bacterium]
MHQVTSITNSQGTSSFQYDLAGNLVAESDPLGRETSRSYNARGQETSVTLPDPDGAGPLTAPVFTKAFNARGELVSQADAMGNITSWTYNAQGQALTQTDPDPDGAGPLPAAVTTFTYDLRGLRSSVTDASGNTTSYGYDHAGRLVEEIDPRGNSSYYQYDVAGQVTRVVDRNSRKRDFTYNDLGLVTEEVWVDGFGNTVKTIVHGYDDAGREISISDGVTAYQYQYDLADRVIYTDNAGSVDMPQVQLRSYYDFEGNRTWLGDNLGGGISYAWNNQRLQSMALYTENYKSAQVGFSYDTVGRLSSLTRTANWDYTTTINTTFTLDLLDRGTSITHSKGMGEDASTLSQFTYGYDVGGRVTNYTGPEGSLSYALDTNGQLLSVTGSRSEDYALDANGNRTSNTTTAGNLLLNDGKYSYTYDLEGNQKTKTRISDGQMTEFFWDYRNQLTKALVKDANGILLKELRFTYDVEGRRVGSWVDADGAGPEEPDQVWTVFDGANPYMDFDGDGLLKTRYLYGPGIDELFARIGAGEDPEWYLVDRLGSVRQIVDATGAILDEISYDSFGNVLSETNPEQGDRFKFTGREFSPELGIYYYRARWYDPSSGRFISQDPIGFQAGDPNLYRYVGNAPGDATDPEGKWSFYKWLYTGNGNIHDDIYDKAMTEGGEYLFQHSPFRGGFLLGGVEIKNPSISNKVYGEAVCLGGFSLDDGTWGGTLIGAGIETNYFSITGAAESLEGQRERLLLVDISKKVNPDLPMGFFFSEKSFGVYNFRTLKELHLGEIQIEIFAGAGAEFNYSNFPNYFNWDYWAGRLPLKTTK